MSDGQPTRRDALKLGGAAAASVLLAPVTRATAAGWKQVPIGTQLWCVRTQLATDIPGTLKALGDDGLSRPSSSRTRSASRAPSGRPISMRLT